MKSAIEAFALAWRTGNDPLIQEAACALILAAGEQIPEHPSAGETREQVIRREGAIRGAALRIQYSERPSRLNRRAVLPWPS